MKKQLSYTLIALCATIAISFAAPDNNKDAIISKEKAAWQAFKDKKQDDFKKLVSADLVAVYSNGILTLQKELRSEEHTSELQSQSNLVCRLLLEIKIHSNSINSLAAKGGRRAARSADVR